MHVPWMRMDNIHAHRSFSNKMHEMTSSAAPDESCPPVIRESPRTTASQTRCSNV